MNSNEINKESSSKNDNTAVNPADESKAAPKPMKKLVRVNRNTQPRQGLGVGGANNYSHAANENVIVDVQEYHAQHEAPSKAAVKKPEQSPWVDVLVKVLSVTVSLIIIMLLILNLPIMNFKSKDSPTKKVSIIYFIRNYKWLGDIEGELDKTNVDTQIDPNKTNDDVDDGLDLPQLIEGQYSVLFLGFDEDVALTDVIWVFQFDILAAKLNVLQIPRDTCLPDYTLSPTGKFNSIYHDGVHQEKSKIQRVVDAVQENFGIPIDSYVTTACFDIVDIVDLIGGIPMHLDNKIIYEAEKVIPAGDVVLTGEQAEWFIRFRHEWLQGDVGRIQNQRRFMAAAMRKLIDIASGNDGHNRFYKYLSEIYKRKLIATDMTVNDLTKLADFAGTLTMESVHVNMVPGEESNPVKYNDNDVYSVHKQATIDMLNKYFRPYQREMLLSDSAIVEFITDYKHTIFDDTGASLGELENSTEPIRDPGKKPAWTGD